MSDKKDLLNDLKIDRSENNKSEGSLVTKFLLATVALVIALTFVQLVFLSEDELIEVNTYTAKSANQSDNAAASVLDASGYVTARMQATVSSKITGK